MHIHTPVALQLMAGHRTDEGQRLGAMGSILHLYLGCDSRNPRRTEQWREWHVAWGSKPSPPLFFESSLLSFFFLKCDLLGGLEARA
jgi:hypothetical protein